MFKWTLLLTFRAPDSSLRYLTAKKVENRSTIPVGTIGFGPSEDAIGVPKHRRFAFHEPQFMTCFEDGYVIEQMVLTDHEDDCKRLATLLGVGSLSDLADGMTTPTGWSISKSSD